MHVCEKEHRDRSIVLPFSVESLSLMRAARSSLVWELGCASSEVRHTKNFFPGRPGNPNVAQAHVRLSGPRRSEPWTPHSFKPWIKDSASCGPVWTFGNGGRCGVVATARARHVIVSGRAPLALYSSPRARPLAPPHRSSSGSAGHARTLIRRHGHARRATDPRV
jgi:hypothetical protein